MPRTAPEYPDAPEQFVETNTDELAEYLRVRREVLTAGLGLLPESTARPRPAPGPA